MDGETAAPLLGHLSPEGWHFWWRAFRNKALTSGPEARQLSSFWFTVLLFYYLRSFFVSKLTLYGTLRSAVDDGS